MHAAIAHAQFETIHPYVDGNGRTGRLLIHRLLPPGAAPEPVALGLLNDPDRYVAGLRHYAAGDLDVWIGAFADAIVLGASAAQRIVARIDQLRDDYRRRVRTRRGSTVPAVIDALLGSPAVTTRSIEDCFGVTEARAQQILHQLADAEILQRRRHAGGWAQRVGRSRHHRRDGHDPCRRAARYWVTVWRQTRAVASSWSGPAMRGTLG